MKANNQFSIAVHIMTCLGATPEQSMASSYLALSINTSASFIRRTLSKLAKAGLVKTSVGKSGASTLAKDAKRISLLDIYLAVEAPAAFSIHEYPVQKVCPVSCKIKSSMQKILEKSQKAMEENLKKTTLADLVADIV